MSEPCTRYIVVGMPRSGTSVTHFALRGHPSVSALREEAAVKPLLTKGMSTFTYGHPQTKKGISRLFDALTSTQSDSEPQARGMKFTTSTEDLARTFVESVQSHLPDVRIIHVVRDDIVARFGSLKKAEDTGEWGLPEKSKQKKEIKERWMDRHDLAMYTIESYQVHKLLRRLYKTHKVKRLSYEDVILEGRLPEYAPLFEFVDIKPIDADWIWDRKFSPPPEEYIINYNTLANLRKQVESELKGGQDPDVLREKYGQPARKEIWRKLKFWMKRPGYATYQLEEYIWDKFA